jgi:hypothetical protein
MQTFKAAALSVTNLYKAAASEHDKAYREGYQDALEDLLGFLDRENLGLQDGEGWRVRRWATERLEGGGVGGSGESEDEEVEETGLAKATRESSPTLRRKTSQDLAPAQQAPRASPSLNNTTRSESAPPITAAPAPPPAPPAPVDPPTPTIQTYTIPQADFTFQSNHQMDMNMDAHATDNNGTVHINVLPPRPGRGARQNSRTTGRTLGHGAGVKRRAPNFFDLGGFNAKDGFGGAGGVGGGGKRGRFT